MGRKKGSNNSNFKSLFYIGAKFGDWVLIDDSLIYKGSQNRGFLKLKCKCGNEQLVEPYTLKKRTSNCCFNCGHGNRGEKHQSFRGYKEIPGSWFKRYSNRSKKWEFIITIEEIYQIWINQNKKCALSGVEINFENSNFRKITNRASHIKKGKKYKYDLVCTASLDRINSLKGYTIDNIQIVHKDINMMKKEYDQNYYIKMCKLIAENNK